MLLPVYGYEICLQDEYKKIIYNPKYMFWNYGSCWDKEIAISDNSYNNIQFVSIMKENKIDKILGYLGCEVNRDVNIVTSLSCINFGDVNFTFSKDFYEFINKLFIGFKFNKIHFTVVIGNPAEKIYDKFIKKHNGEISGYFKNHVKLQDGNFYDVKHYDLFREKYLKS